MTTPTWPKDVLDAATANHVKSWAAVNPLATDDQARAEAKRYQDFATEGQEILLDSEEEIWVKIPKLIRVRLDNSAIITLPAGIRRIKRSVANNWYARINGVEECEDPSETHRKRLEQLQAEQDKLIEDKVQERLDKLGIKAPSYTPPTAARAGAGAEGRPNAEVVPPKAPDAPPTAPEAPPAATASSDASKKETLTLKGKA